MTEIKDVMAWADEVCTQALTEARGGNPTLANRVGANSSLKMYFDNVHGTRNVQKDSFPAFYPAQWSEITRLYEGYIQDQEIAGTVDKVAALETRMDEQFEALKQQLADLTESLKLAPVEAEKPKAAKGKGKKVEAVEAEEPVTDDGADGESEA